MDESKIYGREGFEEEHLNCECNDDFIFLSARSFNTDVSTYRCMGCGTLTYVP